jgi:hypothetical protein
MNPESDQQFDDLIGAIMADDVPPEVDQRMRAQLTSFRSRFAAFDD